MKSERDQEKAWVVWLATVCLLILAIVTIGGVTRLTRSGLSIVEWRPVSGMIPPLSLADWEEAFAKYRQFPEYQLLRQGMTLAEFKFIFLWEYFHRLVARLIGVVFVVPWLYFVIRGQMKRPLAMKLFFGFILGGLQGLLGWYMVKSGLVKNPHVSHYRLAAHLSLALGVLCYLFWILLGLRAGARRSETRTKTDPRLRRFAIGLVFLVCGQILYGAFTAGLKAGFGFNTFPLMQGEWLPAAATSLQPYYLNFLENPWGVQFMHRVLAWTIAFCVPAFWFYARPRLVSPEQRRALDTLLAVTGIQFALGVVTLLFGVPVALGAIHQLGACILLLAAVYLNHALIFDRKTV